MKPKKVFKFWDLDDGEIILYGSLEDVRTWCKDRIENSDPDMFDDNDVRDPEELNNDQKLFDYIDSWSFAIEEICEV